MDLPSSGWLAVLGAGTALAAQPKAPPVAAVTEKTGVSAVLAGGAVGAVADQPAAVLARQHTVADEKSTGTDVSSAGCGYATRGVGAAGVASAVTSAVTRRIAGCSAGVTGPDTGTAVTANPTPSVNARAPTRPTWRPQSDCRVVESKARGCGFVMSLSRNPSAAGRSGVR